MKINNDIKQSVISLWLRKLVVFSFVLISVGTIYANPEGGVVTAGEASIHQTASTTTINQTSDKAIIEWNSFNIGANEATHFQQPNSNSIALNRINPDQGASQIYGQLTSTGRIVLVNQSGFFFGSGAHVDVGSMIASTTGISDQNFLAGNFIFDQTSVTRGVIINQGTIIAASNGLIALIGANVSNEGLIQATGGHVILASGNKFTLDLASNGLIHFVVDEASLASGVDQNGNQMRDGIKNSGTILADGGKILLTANDAQHVVDNAINLSGVLQARSVSEKNGEIILSSTDEGIVKVSGGLLDVSGKSNNETGGVIKVLGSMININSGTVLDASGNMGGGTILVGGNFYGAGPERNALLTYVSQNSLFNADAIINGHGGNVAVWSNRDTYFHGKISAKGGALGGDGGFVETSGHYLNVDNAQIFTLAAAGKKGTWLLDPTNIWIALDQASATAAGMVGTDSSANTGDGGFPNIFSASGAVNDSLLTTTALQAALANTDVRVITTNGAGAGDGNITVVDSITWNGAATNLLLSAANNIYINAAITSDAGSLSLQAANSPQSITTSINGSINVYNFNLIQGQWHQVGTLPSFNVANNFQIGGGVPFLRASSGDGTSGNPYIIEDIYGLQGISSSENLLSSSFALGRDIDASITSKWNSGEGFRPIGLNTGNPVDTFTGNFDGQNHIINGLFINQSSGDQGIGLFGYVNNSVSLIKNLGLTNINITGGIITGGFIGYLQSGTIQNAYTTGTVNSAAGVGNYVGGFAGMNDSGAIYNSFSGVNVTSAGAAAGGFIGANFNIIDNIYSYGLVSNSGGGSVGGLAALSTGGLTNGYWDTQTSGQQNSSDGIGMTTAELQAGLPTGFSSPTWNIIAGDGTAANGSYPYLSSFYSATPRVLSGYAPGGSDAATGLSGSTIRLIYNGNFIDTATTLENGFYYFLQKNGTIADNNPFLLYIDDVPTRANVVGMSAASGGSSVLLNMSDKYLNVYGHSTTAIKNSDFATVLGAYVDSDIMFVPDNNDLVIGNLGDVEVNFTTKTSTINTAGVITHPDTSYEINGALTYQVDHNGLPIAGEIIFNGPVTFSGTGIANTPGTNQTYNGNITLTNNSTIIGGGVLTIGVDATNTIDNNGNTLTFYADSASTVNSTISGAGDLIIDGTGPITLNAANTYTGTTTVSGALVNGVTNAITSTSALQITGNYDLNGTDQTLASITGKGLITSTNGASTLTINNSTDNAYNGSLDGTLSIVKTGAGKLTLQSSNANSGTTSINQGILQIDEDAGLGTTNVIVNSGGQLLLNGVVLTNALDLSGTGVNNGGALATTGSTANFIDSDVTLSGNTLISITNSGDSLTLAKFRDLSGAYDLTTIGDGTLTLKGTLGLNGALNSFTSNTNLVINTNKIETDNNQTYNAPITLLNPITAMTTYNGGNITFNSGATITGNGNAITIVGSNGTSNLILNNSANQIWNISSNNGGTVDGIINDSGTFNFIYMSNVTGGSGNNTFNLSDGISIDGTINGSTGTNIINFTSYTSPISILMSADYNGSITNNGLTIANYANIQTINASTGSTLQTPNKTNEIVIASPTVAYVNDPFYFSNVTNFIGLGNTTMSLPASAVVNTANNTISYNGNTYTYSNISFVNPSPSPTPPPVNINNIMAQFTQPYYTTQLLQEPVNPDVSSAMSIDGLSPTSTSESSNPNPILPTSVYVIQNTSALSSQASIQQDTQPLKITTKGACGL